MKRITILLADDHTVVRQGFRQMLELEKDFQVVGEAQDGREAVAMVKQLRPDVVLMDIAMPRLNGFEATRQILKTVHATKVLILSAHNDDAFIIEATHTGAAGFLLKQNSAHMVGDAIRQVQNGKTFFGPVVARRLHQLEGKSPNRAAREQPEHACLTSRELEVFQLIAEGYANKQIAAELGIGTKTVEKHREHLMRKINVHDTAGLTRYAISAGVIESSVQLTVV
jgi:DNA-binding NarL/FixJ family response regulator